jgi:hypothetical protein
VRRFLLARIALVRCEGVIERLSINVLGVGRQMVPDRRGEIGIGSIWHRVISMALKSAHCANARPDRLIHIKARNGGAP